MVNNVNKEDNIRPEQYKPRHFHQIQVLFFQASSTRYYSDQCLLSATCNFPVSSPNDIGCPKIMRFRKVIQYYI